MSKQKVGPNPTISFLILFASALGAAWILYDLLESTGAIKNKGVELGGAAAGFVLFFWFGHKVFSSLLEGWERRTGASGRIEQLEEHIASLDEANTPPIEQPDGFVKHVSRDHGIGFSRPQTWTPHAEVTFGTFLRPMDAAAKKLLFRGNITLTVTPYSIADQIEHHLLEGTPESNRLRAPILGAALTFKTPPETVTWEDTYIQNRKAMRGIFTYSQPQSGTKIYAEVVTVLDPPRQQLFIFALHEASVRADDARSLFRRVVSTVRLW